MRRLEDELAIVDKDREAADRPQRGELGCHRIAAVEQARIEGDVLLVEGGLRLLDVGGKGWR